MKIGDKMNGSVEDYYTYSGGDSYDKENHHKSHSRQISLMDGDEARLSEVLHLHHHQRHSGAFQPYNVDAVPLSPPPHRHREDKCYNSYDQYEGMAQYRDAYDEEFHPTDRVHTPPPPYPPAEKRAPEMKHFTRYPSTENRIRHVYPSSFWNHQHHHHANDDNRDHYQQGQQWDAAGARPHPDEHSFAHSPSSPFNRNRGGNLHYSYTFDRHGALDSSRHSDTEGSRYLRSSPPRPNNYHNPNGHFLDGEINPTTGENSSFSYPHPSSLRPIMGAEGVDHRASFTTMMEDATKTPRLPEAASEVDFDVMQPPMTPVMKPSSEPLKLSPTDLNTYDVLLGRGGGTNGQIGNRHFRSLVQAFQPIYLTMKRKDKPLMARSIVLIVRKRGGRFLKKDIEGEFYEVGDTKAEAKASQALREGMEVRATTRKRKEMYIQQREMDIEHERRKMMRVGYSSDVGRMYMPEEHHRMHASRNTVANASSMNEEDYYRNTRCSSPTRTSHQSNYNNNNPPVFLSPAQNTVQPPTGVSSEEQEQERFADAPQEGNDSSHVVPV